MAATLLGRKRSLVEEFGSHKRVKFGGLQRLRGLFPMMEDEVLRGVLESCGDLDAAIEKLTSLRVSEERQKTADDWVTVFVSEMQQCRGVPEARTRAALALASFEKFVESRSADNTARLEKENIVLKRAVAIQAQRLQADKDLISSLRKINDDQTDKLKQAQLSNYSLSVHLQQATKENNLDSFHDVF